jgi:hypothetical protein
VPAFVRFTFTPVVNLLNVVVLDVLSVAIEHPLHDLANSEKLATLHRGFTLELVAIDPVLALAFLAAVRDLTFLSTGVPASNTARATMGSRLGADCALMSAHFAAVHS